MTTKRCVDCKFSEKVGAVLMCSEPTVNSIDPRYLGSEQKGTHCAWERGHEPGGKCGISGNRFVPRETPREAA